MPDKEPRKPDEEITVVEDGMYDPPETSEDPSDEEVRGVRKAGETVRPKSGGKRVPDEDEEEDEPVRKAAASGSGFGGFIRRISIKGWLLIIVLLMILICAMLFLFHRNFRVQEIHVVGNSRFTQEEILQASGLKKGDHLYANVGGSLKEIARLQYGKIRQKIIAYDPYIADAKVYPHYPGEVYIEVTERRKVAYVAIPDGYAIISEDSVVLEIATGDVPQGIPEIRGLPIRSAQIGKKLDLTSSDGYDICITVLGAILGSDANAQQDGDDFNFLSHVICVRYCENMTTFIDLSVPDLDHTISVKLGSLQTISDQMTWLRYAVTSGYFAGKPGTVLDMTGSKYILR